MTEQHTSRLPCVSSAQDKGSKKNIPDSSKTPENVPRGSSKQVNRFTPVSSPTKPGSPVKASLPSASPRLWGYRPKPARTLSTPLARSQSARAPSADRRGRLRGDGPPVSTTYRDDYRSPEEISYKLHSLNLETSLRALPDTSTTYRESYQWRRFDAFPRTSRDYKAKDNGGNSRGKHSEISSQTNDKTRSSVTNQLSQSGNYKASEASQNLQPETTNRSSPKTHARRPQFLSKDPFWTMDNSCHKISASKTAPSTPSKVDSVFQTVL